MSKISSILKSEGLIKKNALTSGMKSDVARFVYQCLYKQNQKFLDIPSLEKILEAPGNFIDTEDGESGPSERGWNALKSELKKGFQELSGNVDTLMDDLFPEGFFEE